jgi:hypothetical protein
MFWRKKKVEAPKPDPRDIPPVLPEGFRFDIGKLDEPLKNPNWGKRSGNFFYEPMYFYYAIMLIGPDNQEINKTMFESLPTDKKIVRTFNDLWTRHLMAGALKAREAQVLGSYPPKKIGG